MEEQRESTRYWCHECCEFVNPIMELESIKCSLCQGDFMEEMDPDHHQTQNEPSSEPQRGGVPLWAPILLGLMTTGRPRRNSQAGSDEENRHQGGGGEPELDPERRRIFAGAGESSESENNFRERVILVNPFSQTIIVHGGSNGGNPVDSGNLSQNHPQFGDYFIGPGLEQLLQRLSENDPNRYGTPPANKDAITAMPTVTIEENSIQCSVCLEEFGIGDESREMPCKHKFHGECILPWLDLHSSCPVCRHQLPADESKINRDVSRGDLGNSNAVSGEPGNEENRFSVSLPWPFSGLFLSPRSNRNNFDASLVMMSSPTSSARSHQGDGGEDSH